MIYICIPAHNEEQTVGVVLWKVRQVMAALGRDYQLLVTDDGSTDRTPAVLEPYTRVLPLTVYRTESRRGYAAALELLLVEAVQRSEYPRRDVIVVLQADFSEDPQHVETLIKRIESGADVVASNTVYAGVRPRRRYRWARVALNRLLRRFPWPDEVRDPISGLNAYRVATVRHVLDDRTGERLLRYEGWAANAELLRECVQHARRVDVVELEHRRERLQRADRFHLLTALRDVLALVRGQPPAVLPAGQLQADSVHGGRSLRTLVAESLRDSADGTMRNGAPAEPNGRRRRSGRSDRGAPGEGQRRRRSKTGSAGGAEGDDRGRQRRRRKPEAAAQSPDQSSDGEPTRKRKSRKRRKGPRPETAGSMAQETVDAGTSETGDAVEAQASASAEGESASNGTEGAQPRRRRRGSRGGRRRRRSAGTDRSNDTNENNGSAPDGEAPD